MTIRTRKARWGRGAVRLGAVVAFAFVVGACSGGDGDQQSHDAGGGEASLAHIHGLGVNPADDTLYAGSHHGVFRITGNSAPEQIAGLTRDFMGFTIVGPDHFLGSGHAGPDEQDQPGNLGLIESTDAGQTWQPVSLSGEVDFHAMQFKHDRVYGWDSQTGQLMVSEDKKSWDRRAEVGLADIAVSPDDAEEILATTRDGVARSTDGGREFSVVDDSPMLFFLDWPSSDRLVGVDPEGAVHVSDDGGATWAQRDTVSGSPQAITTHGEDEIYIATDAAIYHSEDNGETFTVFQQL
ncbi:MAG: exo-alpha-sialidase [Actinophytocola sp.]|nr:exo-alpha-sialidase [Actinophytocola sp.]